MGNGDNTMNTDAFTGRAQAYTQARPGYPDEAIEYIRSLVSTDAVFADIGAGTGKFSECIAKHGYKIYAVEPNSDMRVELKKSLAPYPNAEILIGTAEATTLPDHSVDVITCAQALGWFDLPAFRTECRRIGKSGATVVSLHNTTPGDNFTPRSHRLSSKQAAEQFFQNPLVREFPNIIFNTRDRWIQSRISISDSPKPFETGYDEYIAEANEIFDRYNVDGYLRNELVTVVYSERV
jgi:ubiquinone/menaquinone biosynthesis C-methylase UbiE